MLHNLLHCYTRDINIIDSWLNRVFCCVPMFQGQLVAWSEAHRRASVGSAGLGAGCSTKSCITGCALVAMWRLRHSIPNTNGINMFNLICKSTVAEAALACGSASHLFTASELNLCCFRNEDTDSSQEKSRPAQSSTVC